MRRHLPTRVAALLIAASAPASAVTIDFESLTVGDGLAEINAVAGPLGATFDAVNTTDPPAIVVDPGDAGNQIVDTGTEPGGADLLVTFDDPVDFVRVRFVDQPGQTDATVTLVAYNHTDTAAAIQTTGGVVGFAQSTEPATLEIFGNDIKAVQMELSGSPLFVDDVEFDVSCGNGTVGSGEACDDGATSDGDGCDAACQWEAATPGVLRNPGFEISEFIDGGFPDTFGDWATDTVTIVSALGDIAPFEGAQMACFDATAPDAQPDGSGSDAIQLVDVSHRAAEIDAGALTASVSARFDRLEGKDSNNDTAFYVGLAAHSGTPDAFPSEPTPLGESFGVLDADADPATWEELTATLPLPPGTRYVAVLASAGENVQDDDVRPEFQGHCVDAVAFSLEDTPSACPPTPAASCLTASKGSLSIVEKKPGNEKWKAKMKEFGASTTQADFGDPVGGTTAYAACLYAVKGGLVAGLGVARAGDLCGTKQKPCWKAKGDKGFTYKDPDAAASGVKKLGVAAGDAGKGKAKLQAGNKAQKGQTSLPVGVASALVGGPATLQILADDGACFEVFLDVKKSDASQWKGKTYKVGGR